MENIEMMSNESNPSANLSSWMPWIVCMTAALFFFYEFIQMNMFNSISSSLMQSFGLDATRLGSLSANYFYADLIFLFPAGILLDRFSTKRIIILSLLMCIFGTFALGFATNVQFAAFFRFLTGIGSAFCFLSCVRLASRWFPSERMALVTGLVITMAMMGGTVAQVPMTHLVQMVGWRHALMIDGILGLFILALILVYVRDYPVGENEAQQIHHEQIKSIGFWPSMRKSYLNLQNWLCGLYTCLMNLPLSLLGALWGVLYLQQAHHYTANEAALITSMIFIGTIIGSPLAGWISDTIGKRKSPMIVGALLSLCCVYPVIYWNIQSVTVLGALFFAIGLFSSTQVISYPTAAENNPASLTATSVSVVSFSVISGYAIFQPIFGRLMDLHWNHLIVNKQAIYTAADFHSALMIIPIGFVVALFAAMLVRETNCRRKET